MATSSKSSVYQGSNEVKDYICNACEDKKNVETSADFYCKQCDRFYCGNCNDAHGKALAKHTVFGRAEIDKWPVSKKVVDFLQTCDFHKDHKIDNFCNLHRQLCCPQCLSDQHRLCLQVTPLPQASTGTPTDFKNLPVRTQGTLSQIRQFQTYQEGRMKSLKASYKEHEKDMVEDMRLNINSTMNETHEQYENIVQNTVIEMSELITSLLAVFEKSTIKEKKKELTLKLAPLMSVRNSCIRLHNELFQLHIAIQNVLGRLELSFIASIKCQAKIQQSETFLNENFPNHVLTVQGKSEYNVRIPSDSYRCRITGICVLPDGQVLVGDWNNNTVKLLNQQYQVVSHCGVDAMPHDMCIITPSEVAVTVGNKDVQFITVTQGQLVPGRKFQLPHTCRSIAHHQGDLFITSGTALYKYSGKLVCMLYHDGSDMTVWGCAVSPTGDRLYITSYYKHKVLTLARDGTVLATFKDSALQSPTGLHVTPAGQVLVCGSDTVLQVDREGRRKLATLTTRDDGVVMPHSVCYSSITSSIIVGQFINNNILVLRVE